MSDFETVRANPLNYESLRALDRIEAEVERLEGIVTVERVVKTSMTAEVERLLAELDHYKREDYAAQASELRAEVERLRAALEQTAEHEPRLTVPTRNLIRSTLARAVLAEDQRLQHIRSESSRLVQIDAARDKAEAEVEWLRAKWVMLFDSHAALAEQNERLRIDMQRVWTSRDHSHARDIARNALAEEKE